MAQKTVTIKDEELHRQIKVLSAERGVKIQDILNEGIGLVLAKYSNEHVHSDERK